MLTALIKSIPQVLLAVAILAVIGALGVRGTLSAGEALGVIGTLLGAVGVTGGIVLGSASPNTQLLPHVIVALATLGVVLALALYNVISGTEVVSIIGFFVGGGAAGGAVGTTVAALSRPASTPPTVPTSVAHPGPPPS